MYIYTLIKSLSATPQRPDPSIADNLIGSVYRAKEIHKAFKKFPHR